MLSAKTATPGFIKIGVFWNKVYDVIIFVHGVNTRFSSRDPIDIIDVVMWPKFGNCSISMRKNYHNLNLIRIWLEKLLFWGVVLV